MSKQDKEKTILDEKEKTILNEKEVKEKLATLMNEVFNLIQKNPAIQYNGRAVSRTFAMSNGLTLFKAVTGKGSSSAGKVVNVVNQSDPINL